MKVEKEIINIILEEKHDDNCFAFERDGTLRKLKGMEPDKCTCSKPLRILEKIKTLLNQRIYKGI